MGRVDPFPASEFDAWADTYDADVVSHDQFPFAGYRQVLEAVIATADPRPGMSVLDIGIGTGNLARLFIENGCRVWGSDYSPMMLEKARQKVPEATLVAHDLREDWPTELERRFDRIVSAYTFHHFDLSAKVSMLAEASKSHLLDGGRIVIADISFRNMQDMRSFAALVGKEWEEEPYWQADDALEALKRAGMNATYQQVSACGGVYRIEAA
jgi:putative AdoMet-dependent methyltransferase